uniref:PsbG n=1 Tax=Maerua crassifolia TaxID=1198337 RepID=A0A8E5JU75_9ROSI|nr:PsbG [Maerua crassifolia]QVD39962.1 PsbG [Maerua crassifolia]
MVLVPEYLDNNNKKKKVKKTLKQL